MSVRLLIVSLVGLLALGGVDRSPAGPPAETKPACRSTEGKLVRRVYPVADLIVPLDGAPSHQSVPNESGVITSVTARGTAPACTSGCRASRCTPGETLENRLIQLIVDTVAPATWQEQGGQATIRYYPLGMALVVHQTPAVHQEIAELLADLRRTQDMDVAVEVRLITVPDRYLETVAPGCSKNKATGALAFLNDAQMLTFMKALQDDRRTSCMQAPKLTVANGQRATVEVTDRQFYVTRVSVVQAGGQTVMCPVNEALPTGVKLTVQPAISADRRYVRLGVMADLTSLESAEVPLFPVTAFVNPVAEGGEAQQPLPFTQFVQQPRFDTSSVGATVCVPDGGTVLLGGLKQVRQGRCECCAPVLADVPFLSRLFTTMGYAQQSEQLLVLVTPRIIINEEPESRKSAQTQPRSDVTCPYLKEQQTRQLASVPVPAPPATVLENLEKLEQAREIYEAAERAFREGRRELAESGFELVRALYPGSRYEGMASRRLMECRQTALLSEPSHGDAEEQQEMKAAPACPRDDSLATLLQQYQRACAEGRLAEATRLAVQALAINPTCFGNKPCPCTQARPETREVTPGQPVQCHWIGADGLERIGIDFGFNWSDYSYPMKAQKKAPGQDKNPSRPTR